MKMLQMVMTLMMKMRTVITKSQNMKKTPLAQFDLTTENK